MRVELDLFKGDIIAVKYYDDGRKEYVHGDVEVNDMLDNLYAKEGKSLFELIADNTLVITKRVWSKYELLNNKAIIRRTADEKMTRATTKKTTKPVEETSAPTIVPVESTPYQEEVTSSPVVIPSVEEEVVTPEIVDTVSSETISSDGAIDVGESSVSETTEVRERKTNGSKGIKNLKRVGFTALALVVGGYILVGGFNNLFKKKDNNDHKDNHNDNHRYEENIENFDVETTHEPEQYETFEDDPDTIYRYVEQGSLVKYDDMQTQIDGINEVCFSFQPCQLENLVVDSDKDAISTICGMRNRVLNNACDTDTYLNNAVNYLFENGTIFDGKVIKGYDSLSPYAQYIVLVANQSILQLNTNYEHTTAYNAYNFDILVNSFDYMINDTYTTLINNNKIR